MDRWIERYRFRYTSMDLNTHIEIDTAIDMHTCIHTYIGADISVHKGMDIDREKGIDMHVCTYTYIHMYVSVYIYIYLHVYLCVCLYVCIQPLHKDYQVHQQSGQTIISIGGSSYACGWKEHFMDHPLEVSVCLLLWKGVQKDKPVPDPRT